MKNKNLSKAKKEKNDEFYTLYEDIEKEMVFYKEELKNKILYFNCDDYRKSNFYKYFKNNFKEYELKKIIATCYNENEKGYYCEYDGKEEKKKILKGNGDFRNQENIEILKTVDIVVTNPPFSLFREFVSQLFEFNKKFIVLGNVNAITYKETFKLIKKQKIWLGANTKNGNMEFQVPDSYNLTTTASRVDNNGKKFIKVKGVRWFTNLEHKKRNEDLILYKKYTSEEYPKYDNYDAINIDKTKDIPIDYDGTMGVPITFLDKHNPNQFEIIGLGKVGSCNFTQNKKMEILKNGKGTGKFTTNAKGALYMKYNPLTDKKPPVFKDLETGELYSSIYARVLIKKIK